MGFDVVTEKAPYQFQITNFVPLVCNDKCLQRASCYGYKIVKNKCLIYFMNSKLSNETTFWKKKPTSKKKKKV